MPNSNRLTDIGIKLHMHTEVVGINGLFKLKGAFGRAIFLCQRPIVTETMANNLRSHIATKSVKETMSKNLC